MVTAALAAGFVGCVLFVTTFLVDGATRAGYRPLYHPVSALARGSRGWLQTGNFIACGTLLVIGAGGAAASMGRWLAPALLAVHGLALVASGIFPMDAIRGYPPGTPAETPSEYSRTHQRHDHAGAVVFALFPINGFVLAFALPGLAWTIASIVVGVVLVAMLFVFNAAWERDWSRTGLIQRLILLTGLGWFAAVYLHLLR